jgi:segregation and condensation protein B
MEALLFLSSEPIKLAQLADSSGIEKVFARELLDELVLDYSERDGGILLKEVANAYQFQTNDKFFKVLGTIFKEKRRETLSKSTLDTLAIVAYKQPITLPEIDEIRGVSSRAMITTLISKKLVKAVGQKEVPGRPTLYGTTNDFLLHFGLNKLSDLPTPVEVKELNLDNLDDIQLDDDPEEEIPKEVDVEDPISEVPVEEPIQKEERNENEAPEVGDLEKEETEPTESSDLVEETEPTESSDLVEETELIESSDLVEETEPIESSDLVEETEPIESSDLVEETEPIESSDLVEETEPSESSDLVEETEPIESSDLVEETDSESIHQDLEEREEVIEKQQSNDL